MNNKNHNTKISNLTHYLRWLSPGIGIKRWILITLLGTTFVGVGVGVVLLHFYRTAPESWWLPLLSVISLRFLARPIRALIFIGIGFVLIIGGIYGMSHSLIKPFVKPGQKVVDELTQHKKLEKGPKIVAIGGGHGLANLLRGIKEHTYNITAIVTVADDGGSSGKLRRGYGILPPGDLRNCLAALSDDEALLSQLFQYRFPDSQTELDGHSFGNLFITALADIMGGFEEAVAESGRVLAVKGRVLPSTINTVSLIADVNIPMAETDLRIEGESAIPRTNGKVKRVYLQPEAPPAFPETINAILNADLIVIGPGSLYTSILPNLLVPEITQAIRSSKAFKVFVCNIATQKGETDHYTCEDHIHAVENHVGAGIFDLVLVNRYPKFNVGNKAEWVQLDHDLPNHYQTLSEKLYDETNPTSHDAGKLAKTLIEIYHDQERWLKGNRNYL